MEGSAESQDMYVGRVHHNCDLCSRRVGRRFWLANHMFVDATKPWHVWNAKQFVLVVHENFPKQ